MKQKEKEYLIAFKLYIDNYDSRYRYPKWIRAINKKDAITKYIEIIKPDVALGACIIMDERPVKQNDAYRKGNLKLLEMMISQLNNSIDPTKPNHAPRPDIIDMVAINEELYSTSRLVGVPRHMLPSNEYIYTDDFFEYVRDYITDRYNYEFYNDYTLMKIRDELQSMYDNYSKHGILPWQDNKEEENNMNNSEPSKMKKYELATENIGEPTPRLYNLHIVEAYDVASAIKDYNRIYIIDDAREQIVVIRELEEWHDIGAIVAPGVRSRLDRMKHNATEETETLQEEDVEEMKENIVKGNDTTNMTERASLEIIDHEPIFDIEAAGLDKGYAYLLEKINDDDGSIERKVIVIIDISPERIDYIWRESAHDTIRREGTLTPLGFERGNYKLYPVTAEDIK